VRSPCIPLVLALCAAATHLTQAQSDWDLVRTSYGNLTHVAGLGFDQDVNSWTPAYEGRNAVEVELSNPHMAQADAAGNIYIADKESHSILKVTTDGKIRTAAGIHIPGFNGDGDALPAQLNNPNGLFVLADGTFYIVDLDNRRIRRVGTDRQLVTIVHEPAFLGGRALWVSPDEQLIYYAGRDALNSPSVKRWTPSGGIEVVSSGFVSLGNITVDPMGRPLVTEDIGNRVWRIETDGAKTLLAGNGNTFGGGDGFPATSTGLDRVRGIACLPSGGFFLATQKGAHIWYVDTAGIIHKMIDCASSGNVNAGNGQPYNTPGVKMSEPRAITIAPNGDLIITTSDYGHIKVIKCLRPPVPPVRLELEAGAGSDRRLRWIGPAWQSYYIEYNPGLNPAAWQTIGVRTTVAGLDTLHPLPSTGSASQGFYRVRVPSESVSAGLRFDAPALRKHRAAKRR
jgi:hypothetical protein